MRLSSPIPSCIGGHQILQFSGLYFIQVEQVRNYVHASMTKLTHVTFELFSKACD